MIYSIARYVALLKRDGLSEPQALRKIDDVLRLRALSDGHHATTVEEILNCYWRLVVRNTCRIVLGY